MAREEDNARAVFDAALRGVDLKKIAHEKGIYLSEADSKEQSSTIFRDPSDYEHLSESEKEELTKKMMGFHRLKVGEILPRS